MRIFLGPVIVSYLEGKKDFQTNKKSIFIGFSLFVWFFFYLVEPTGSSAQTVQMKEVEPCSLCALSCRCRDSDGDNRGMKDKTQQTTVARRKSITYTHLTFWHAPCEQANAAQSAIKTVCTC